MTPAPTIEVYFDLICPWCLIGKRHLATALEKFRQARPEVVPRVVWQSYPLLPDTPVEGLPYQEFYVRRLGSPAAVAARRAQVQEAARPAGIQFAFDRISVMPNTLAAHRLIAWVESRGGHDQAEQLIEKLFTAYFMAGKNIGDRSILLDLAAECGIAAEPRAMDDDLPEAPGSQNRRHVSGVPFYIFNNRLAISGAVPPESLLEAMLESIG